MDFKGRTALITGASVGIGNATAVKLASCGANVIIIDINMEKLETLYENLKQYGTEVLMYECDVSNEARVNEVVADAYKKLGKIDILVNNAAIWRCWDSFLEVPTSEWQRYFDINVMSVVYFTKAILPKMLENNYGRIINVSSVAGVYGNANMVHYSATKGAVNSLTKALAKEVTHHNVLVNSICPGSVSPSERDDINFYHDSELSFMGRTGTAMENANLIAFLASDEATYIAGQNIQIDGCRKKQ